ncbi:MAG: DNA-directed RNA polymerase subunit A' [Candidatus Micrarchaeota archaeon]|nr:DNA-directed RNA polymerase subunit A' [Candidatus Micrarchaeota archaeon]
MIDENEVFEKYISKIKFTLFSPEMIRKMSAVKLFVPDTYNDDGYPIEGGFADLRMGVIDPGLRCKTCGGTVRTCPGHFGSIELIRPVIHPEFAPMIYMFLRSTCQTCGRVLLTGEEINEIKGSLMTRDEMISTVITRTKKVKNCPHCQAEQKEIKLERPTSFYEDERLMLPTEVRDRLAKISDDDLRELGFDPEYSRPEWAVLTVLPVPPVNVRPSITLESGERSEDNLTHKLVEVLRINQRLESNINAGAPQLIIEDLWELLQYHVTTYFNNESPNIPPATHRSGMTLKTLAQRLKGKEGRFRYNLSGKRVNFSARTVVSPDGCISINEVGVPKQIANELTIPIKVTDWNIEECKKMILSNESANNVTAVYVTSPNGRRRKITDTNKEELANELAAGWTVERQLKDGDVVLFNRYPSLHRMSIMAHKVKILSGKTFRVPPSVTPPYNADFDGDEMNIHVPQKEEARAEAETLMLVEKQIISPQHGHAIIGPTEDHITGTYLLSLDETVFTKEEAMDLLALAGIYELPKPDVKDKYSGKAIISQLLPKNLNLRIESKIGKKGSSKSIVEIKDGKMISGYFEKKSIHSVIEAITLYNGNEAARKFIDGIGRIAGEVITRKGMTVSMKDYTLSENGKKKVKELVENAEKQVNVYIMQYKNKTLEREPGKSLKETLESKSVKTLGDIRNDMSKLLEEDLGQENKAIVIAKIGARGSIINVTQMSGAIAQQVVREKRLHRGYRYRPLSHFKQKDLSAVARGFIKSNFLEGLNPIEYFFQSMSARESIVNTAIRTARSGYMQRRMMNALQDLVVKEDYTVRDGSGRIVQVIYGGDGKDTMKIKKINEELTAPVGLPERE